MLRAINVGPDRNPWLDDTRLSQMISEIDRPAGVKLLEINNGVMDLLFKGTAVEVRPNWDSGKDQHIAMVGTALWFFGKDKALAGSVSLGIAGVFGYYFKSVVTFYFPGKGRDPGGKK